MLAVPGVHHLGGLQRVEKPSKIIGGLRASYRELCHTLALSIYAGNGCLTVSMSGTEMPDWVAVWWRAPFVASVCMFSLAHLHVVDLLVSATFRLIGYHRGSQGV